MDNETLLIINALRNEIAELNKLFAEIKQPQSENGENKENEKL